MKFHSPGLWISALMTLCSLTTNIYGAEVKGLRCEYRENPRGIDAAKPRISWCIASDRRGEKQTAYQVLVASSEKILSQDKGDLWDSGKVGSGDSNQVVYAGKPLPSRSECYWKVRIWDAGDKPVAWSKPSSWTMGLLASGDWQAKWIGSDKSNNPDQLLEMAQWIWFPEGEPAVRASAGTRYFRRTLALPTNAKIAKASCRITADNSFELYVNGKNASHGNNFKTPVTVDLTGLLQAGSNVFAVAATNAGGAPSPAGLIATIRMELSNGDPLLLTTDASWKSSEEKVEGWERADFNDAQWPNAKSLGTYGIKPWRNVSIGADDRRLPARYLRREFTIGKKISRATAYVSGLGFFDLYLNGQKVSDQMMNPALSDYRKSVYYVTFDISSQLKRGVNALGVTLGNGRYYAPRKGTYGLPKLLLQMEVQYADGTKEQILSDESWKLTTEGPIRANNEFDGEEYDARMEMAGWNNAGFDDSKWEKAQSVAAPGGLLLSQMIEPMRVTETIKPVGISNPKPGVFVVDMGQNFYGTVRLKAKGPKGQEVRMTSAYSLLPDGMLKTADNRSARTTDVYTFKGNGEEVWSPQFKGQGFRRIQVTGFPGTPTTDNFEGLVIHTDTEPVGEFECSNDLVNRIHTAMRWGFRMFLRSAPLDPDRDERMPWTGDPAKDAESEAFNFNVAPFYAKWMDDVERSQKANGSLPSVTMFIKGGSDGVEWPSVFTIIPDWFKDFYGDARVAETHYAAMKRWVLAMRMHELPDGTLKVTSYGDWCDARTMDKKVSDNGATPRELVSTAYQYNNCRIMERLARSMGHAEDERIFAEMADKLKTAFNQRFLNPQTHVYQGGTQCGYVLALAFGLVPEGQRNAVIANLVEDIMVKEKGHLSVGLIGMQWLMQTLTDIGRPDVAWTIATQTTRPSWGYMLSKGATTIWERWDCDTRDPGMNSEALLIQAGNLDAWFYQTLAGINYDRQQPGFKHILIKPSLVGDLTWVNAHFDSLYGRISSNWKREGEKLTLQVTIPANTTATVHVPAKDKASVTESGKPAERSDGVKFLRMEKNTAVYAVSSGTYQFLSTLP